MLSCTSCNGREGSGYYFYFNPYRRHDVKNELASCRGPISELSHPHYLSICLRFAFSLWQTLLLSHSLLLPYIRETHCAEEMMAQCSSHPQTRAFFSDNTRFLHVIIHRNKMKLAQMNDTLYLDLGSASKTKSQTTNMPRC